MKLGPGERESTVSRDVIAGCFVCHGSDAHWNGGNVQGVAARHTDATGHETWVTVSMNITYRPRLAKEASGGKNQGSH